MRAVDRWLAVFFGLACLFVATMAFAVSQELDGANHVAMLLGGLALTFAGCGSLIVSLCGRAVR